MKRPVHLSFLVNPTSLETVGCINGEIMSIEDTEVLIVAAANIGSSYQDTYQGEKTWGHVSMTSRRPTLEEPNRLDGSEV